jgi:hypothetical protein
MANEEEKKPGEDQQPPPEMILEQQRDPEEATFAEQSIHEYATWVLDGFRENFEMALDAYTGWATSQADPTLLNDSGHFGSLADGFMQCIANLCGGFDTPVGRCIAELVGDTVKLAVRQEYELSLFVPQLAIATREASWSLRDNLPAILSGQWDQLLDLAYEGSTAFIPAIHQLGLPVAEFSPNDVTQQLQQRSQAYVATVPKKQEEVVQQEGAQGSDETKELAEEQQEAFEEEQPKEAAV